MGNSVKCCDRQEVNVQEQPVGSGDRSAPGVAALPPEVEKVAPQAAAAPPAAATSVPQKDGEYEVILDRSTGDKLGIDVDHQDGVALLIEAINGGVVGTWNKANPSKEVQTGDRIVEVNGVRGEAMKLVDECKQQKQLRVKIKRK